MKIYLALPSKKHTNDMTITLPALSISACVLRRSHEMHIGNLYVSGAPAVKNIDSFDDERERGLEMEMLPETLSLLA